MTNFYKIFVSNFVNLYKTVLNLIIIIIIKLIPCGGHEVAPFGHAQSSGLQPQDFISHLGHAVSRNNDAVTNE